MIVKILDVKIGTRCLGPKAIDFWVLSELENGKIVEIFDLNPFDLRGYEGKYLDCLIEACVGDIEEDTRFIIKGKFIQDYVLPSKWKGLYDPIINHSAVETDYGIFLIDPGESLFDDKDGQNIEFDGFRLDLLAYMPLV
jgi:hypothetical protein